MLSRSIPTHFAVSIIVVLGAVAAIVMLSAFNQTMQELDSLSENTTRIERPQTHSIVPNFIGTDEGATAR